MRDLIVVGGGPAGLATALYAARSGLSVEIREARPGSIDKACGEGLMPVAVDRLESLGIRPDGSVLRGIRYLTADGAHAEARFAGAPGRGVRRTVLHASMRRAIDDASVPVLTGSVAQVQVRRDDVLVDGARARHVVAADGLHSPLRRQLGLDRGPGRLRRYGLRRHVRLAPWTDRVEVYWAERAEAYVTPVGPETVGVAVLSGDRRPFDEHLREFPALLARLRGAEWSSSVRGAGPMRQRSARRVAGRVLLVGDAAGYVDALTGEGIALALAQAEAAVRACARSRATEYEAAWRQIVAAHRRETWALLAAAQVPLVRRRLVPAARAMPGVFSAAVRQIAG